MFWRFTFEEAFRPRTRVLVVNRADVVASRCEACGNALVANPAGDSILVAAALSNCEARYYCRACGDRRWIPTLAGRALQRYTIDWAIPLRNAERAELKPDSVAVAA